jgi:hypothetical protein
LAGHSLLVVNASGQGRGAEPVVARLTRLGWSTSRSGARPALAQAQTVIVYPDRSVAVARALARTIPYKVRLVSCASRCERMRLTIGVDAVAWRNGAKAASKTRARVA